MSKEDLEKKYAEAVAAIKVECFIFHVNFRKIRKLGEMKGREIINNWMKGIAPIKVKN